jgi:hypothetical protein
MQQILVSQPMVHYNNFHDESCRKEIESRISTKCVLTSISRPRNHRMPAVLPIIYLYDKAVLFAPNTFSPFPIMLCYGLVLLCSFDVLAARIIGQSTRPVFDNDYIVYGWISCRNELILHATVVSSNLVSTFLPTLTEFPMPLSLSMVLVQSMSNTHIIQVSQLLVVHLCR